MLFLLFVSKKCSLNKNLLENNVRSNQKVFQKGFPTYEGMEKSQNPGL